LKQLDKGIVPETKSDQGLLQLLQSARGECVAWGFRMICAYLRNQGHCFCKHRAHRIYKEAGMSLHRIPKKGRLERKFDELPAPSRPDQGWAMDFLSEMIIGENRQSVRLINIMDEYSRKDLWVEAHQSCPTDQLIKVLDQLLTTRNCPEYIRCDNGPEFISGKLKDWAEKSGIELRFIQPGKPTQNAFIERLNGTLRRECLNLHWFDSLDELNEELQNWYYTYNFIRPHSALHYKTPHHFEAET
jgi:putative transposase